MFQEVSSIFNPAKHSEFGRRHWGACRDTGRLRHWTCSDGSVDVDRHGSTSAVGLDRATYLKGLQTLKLY